MAGIAGITLGREARGVEEALDAIAHRGPSGRHVQVEAQATLGEVWGPAEARYAQDISAHALVMDAEAHNWAEIAAGAVSPRQALLDCYRQRGPGFVADLDGAFALAIAGPEGVFLARDVVGKSPLYWGRRGEDLCFASEIKAIARWTRDIEEFPPGHYYRPDLGLVSFQSVEEQPPVEGDAEEVARELRARLVRSVQKRVKEGEVGVWLSGGLDSATMAALAARQTSRLETFVVGLPGASDLEHARVVADHIGSRHHERICSPDELPGMLEEAIYHLESFDALLVRSSVLNYLAGRIASEHVPAVLSGEGGDELFAGYGYLAEMPLESLPAELVDITNRLHNTALQRVDRCSAGHGIQARPGFLDRDVLAYALRIPAELKIAGNGERMGKWILRKAVEGLLPDTVTWRPKEKFWEGAGVQGTLAAHAEEVVSDAEFAAERAVSDSVTLNTKEELLYYRIFKAQFGDSVDPALVGRTKGAPSV